LDHPSVETLAKLLAGDLSHEDLLTRLIPHFLEQCPVCRERHQEILRLQEDLGHWDERVAVVEGRQAPELLARLEGLPFEEQFRLVTDDEAFQNWGLCAVLVKESAKAASGDAGHAVDLAELAVKVSQYLGDAYDPNWVLDLRARAHACLGQALASLGELRSAEAAFHEADALLAKSMTGNALVQAEVLRRKAALRRAQGRLEEARELEERARSLEEAGKTAA
jgi:tetratricopeptide (TPR) repeat protein